MSGDLRPVSLDVTGMHYVQLDRNADLPSSLIAESEVAAADRTCRGRPRYPCVARADALRRVPGEAPAATAGDHARVARDDGGGRGRLGPAGRGGRAAGGARRTAAGAGARARDGARRTRGGVLEGPGGRRGRVLAHAVGRTRRRACRGRAGFHGGDVRHGHFLHRTQVDLLDHSVYDLARYSSE